MLGYPTTVGAGVYQVPVAGSRVTVIQGDRELLLVDTGLRGSWPLVRRGLARLGFSPRQVSLIVLTHGHPDHAGGLRRMVAATGAAVAVHRAEAPFITGDRPPPTPFTRPLMAGLARPFLPWLEGGTVPVAHLLDHGDALPFSEEVRVVHRPGHTPGSICLYLPGRGLVLVGDALQYRFRRLGPPAAGVTQDRAQAGESLKRLLALDIQCIGFGHFPALRRDAYPALVRLVHRLETSEKSKGG